MQIIETNNYQIEFGPLAESGLNDLLKEYYSERIKLILVDENTHENCLFYLLESVSELHGAEIIQLPSGEENKTLEVSANVWEAFSEYLISRGDILINLGGGVISDIGGFIASCYKRGIDFVNIPTTLLAMVDASVGGKTGVNLGPYKNQVGSFAFPKGIYMDTVYLDTLPEIEIYNGYAEMLKHGLIADKELFDSILNAANSGELPDDEMIIESIKIKQQIVEEDPYEQGARKKLNFGHTIGHAIEGHFLHKMKISHGHAVALGMAMEAFLSFKEELLSKDDFEYVANSLLAIYELPVFSDDDIHEMIELLNNDKKNESGKIMCSLLDSLGSCAYNIEISEQKFLDTFMHFKNLNLSLN